MDKLLDVTGLNTTICNESCGIKPGEACSSKPILNIMEEFAKSLDITVDINQNEDYSRAIKPVLKAIRDKLDCKTEACILKNSKFVRFAEKRNISEPILSQELKKRFKPKGPRKTKAWLSNVNIDGTLSYWVEEFPFFPCPYTMMDFEKTNTLFNYIDLSKVFTQESTISLHGERVISQLCDSFACVLNTDVSTGPGKHWVSVFVDNRNPTITIEYFNSAGNPVTKPVSRWMDKQEELLKKLKPVQKIYLTQKNHQKEDTECGMYSLYFIRCRLEGNSYNMFLNDDIPDAAMVKFRSYCFRPE